MHVLHFFFSTWFWKAYSPYRNQIVGFNVIRSISHVLLCLETSERDLLKSDYARRGVTVKCNWRTMKVVMMLSPCIQLDELNLLYELLQYIPMLAMAFWCRRPWASNMCGWKLKNLSGRSRDLATSLATSVYQPHPRPMKVEAAQCQTPRWTIRTK